MNPEHIERYVTEARETKFGGWFFLKKADAYAVAAAVMAMERMDAVVQEVRTPWRTDAYVVFFTRPYAS